MPLTEKQAFKVGFLLRCADEGLTIEETHRRVKTGLEKQATPLLGPVLGSAVSGGTQMIKGLLGMVPGLSQAGLVGLLGLPVAAGAGAGLAAAKMTSRGDDALDEAKRDEVVGEYQRLAEEAKRKARAKRLANATGQNVTIMAPSV
jgi:hypothetical protein